MKKSSQIALIGIGLILFSNMYYLITNFFDAWQFEWYHTLGHFWNILNITAWGFIGQFFFKLYKKSK